MGSEVEQKDDATRKADVWNVDVPESDEKAWGEKTGIEKVSYVAVQVSKVAGVLFFLYVFIISLGIMGNAFKVLGGPSAGAVFRNQDIFNNPIAGLVLGVLATVLVQSSSTSSSIIITMTAAGLMKVQNAIPMIMGANIGTSVTNTIVSIGQMGNRNEYRRAFAGATVHDCFNLLTVAVMLPIEAATGLLRHIAEALVKGFNISDDQEKGNKLDFLKKITKPITSRIVQIDKNIIKDVAQASDKATLDALMKKSMILNSQSKDNHLFMDTGMSDTAAGIILLVLSLVLLCTCLILLVKILQSVFRGQAAIWMKKLLNLEFERAPGVADYILILFGAGITVLMQSSSITTSTLTPLVGIGLIRLEKMFPFTVGANLGTTITGILSALASSNIGTGMTVAFSHLLFNIFGFLIWFPLPFMRRIPLAWARFNGNLAADVPIFPVAYIIFVFAILPVMFLLFSLGGVAVIAVLGTLTGIAILSVIVILNLRLTRPQLLPSSLQRDPSWMPRSLMVNPPEEEEVEEEAGGSADLNKGAWWQGTFAWAAGWFILMFLMIGVFNNQWGNLKYTKFDSREHIGIGPWSTCSKIFTEETRYMPSIGQCGSSNITSCLADVASACSQNGFSSSSGANKVYETSWTNCKAECPTEQWVDQCKQTSCSGSLHETQCNNISKAVLRPFTVKYGDAGTVAWASGSKCRPNSEIFSNSGRLAAAGSISIVGLVFAFIAQMLLLGYVFTMNSERDTKMVLVSSMIVWAVTCLVLLVSWAVFAGGLSEEVTAKIIHDSGTGAIIAKGKFSDIIENSGSYSFGYIIGAWILTMPVMAAIGHHLVSVLKSPPSDKPVDMRV